MSQIDDDAIHRRFTKQKVDVHKGNRFDGKNHNWLMIGHYISLPFSYMSFVLKAEFDEDPQIARENFDIEAFNYMINRSTVFIDSNMVRNDHESLEYVLSKMMTIDYDSLGLLPYIMKERSEVP